MKKYLIIGNPLSHSLSPDLHQYWFKKNNISAIYQANEIKDNELEIITTKIRKKEIDGINITLPYKKMIIPFLDEIINDAKDTNSVNIVYLNEEDKLIGENTDVYGLQAGYFNKVIEKDKNYKALVLGAGGVAPSIIFALIKSKVADITLSNRTYEKSLFLKSRFPKIKLMKWNEMKKNTREFDMIVNGTSLGLKNGNEFDFQFNDVKKDLVFIDTIYNPLQTKMAKHFKKKNIKTFNGLDMFIYQGQKSFYLWNKINPEVNDELIKLLESKIR